MSPEHCKNIVNKCYSLTCVKFWRAHKRKNDTYPHGYLVRFPVYKQFPVHMLIGSSCPRSLTTYHTIYFNKIPAFKCTAATYEIFFQGKIMGKAGSRFYGDIWFSEDPKCKKLLMALFLFDKNNIKDILGCNSILPT